MVDKEQKENIIGSLFADDAEQAVSPLQEMTDELADNYRQSHPDLFVESREAPVKKGSEEAIPVDNFDEVDNAGPDEVVEAAEVTPTKPVVELATSVAQVAPSISEALDSVPAAKHDFNSLRRRRMEKASAQAPKPDVSALSIAPEKEVEEVVAGDAPVDALPDIKKFEQDAAAGIDKAMTPEEEGSALLREMSGFGSDGSELPDSEVVKKRYFKDTPLQDNTKRVADALKEAKNGNNMDAQPEGIGNEDRVAEALSSVLPVKPEIVVADAVPLAEPAVAAQVKTEPIKSETDIVVPSEDIPITFTNKNSAQGESVILEAARANAANGTAEKDAKPNVENLMTGGIADKEEPVVDEEEGERVSDAATDQNEAELVANGGVFKDAPVEPAVAEKPVVENTDPHLMGQAGTAEKAEAGALADQSKILDKLIEKKAPLEGQAEEEPGLEAAPVNIASPVVESAPVVALRPAPAEVATVEAAPVVVPQPAAAETATPEAVAVAPLEHLQGDQQPSPELQATALVEQPEAVNADKTGFWKPKAKETIQEGQERKGLFSKIFGKKDKPNQQIMAETAVGMTTADVEKLHPKENLEQAA